MIQKLQTSQRRSTLLSVALALASATGLPAPASFNHTIHGDWRNIGDVEESNDELCNQWQEMVGSSGHLHDEVPLRDDAERDAGEPVDGGGHHQHGEPRPQEQRCRRHRRRSVDGERVGDRRRRHQMRRGLARHDTTRHDDVGDTLLEAEI